MLAVRRIRDAVIATARVMPERHVILQDNAGLGVENLDGLRRAQGKNGGGVSLEIGVQSDGLRADPDAQVDLRATRGDDSGITDDPRSVRLRAGFVGWKRLGLSSGQPRKGQPRRRYQAGKGTQVFNPIFFSR